MSEVATGGCLCGAVRYEVRGPLRDILICHCVECRRWHGNVAASTAAARTDLALTGQRGLRWIASPRATRTPAVASVASAAPACSGTRLGATTSRSRPGRWTARPGCAIAGHWFTSQKGDWYELPDDGLPHHERSAAAEGGDPSGKVI